MRKYLPGDIYDIGSRVKDIDPALSISFDYKKEKYKVSRDDKHIMYVDVGELDARVLTKLRKNDLARRRLIDFIYELERSEDEEERRRAKELSNKIEEITLDKYDRIAGIPHYACGHWRC